MSTDDSTSGFTIPVDPTMRAMATGSSIGAELAAQLAEQIDVPETRRLLYWLNMGAELVKRFPDATQEVSDAYVVGASTSAPSARGAVSFRIDSTGNDAFGDPEDEDDTDARMEIARLLRETATRIEDGADAGKLTDINGHIVGDFELDLTR